ncbi:lipoprotein [Marinobacter sp. F3R08]|nr:lipoprotein [Marinobacter sp. F3R08]
MVLMLAVMVSGCGQKGPLYRDDQGPSMASGTEPVQDQQDREQSSN